MKSGALLIIVNADGKVLLQHKDANAPSYPNQWTLFGGGIEKDESADAAIHRELSEELDLKINHEKHFGKYQDNDVYIVHTDLKVGDLKPHLHEGSDLNYFSETEIKTIPIAETHFKILKDYFSKNKN